MDLFCPIYQVFVLQYSTYLLSSHRMCLFRRSMRRQQLLRWQLSLKQYQTRHNYPSVENNTFLYDDAQKGTVHSTYTVSIPYCTSIHIKKSWLMSHLFPDLSTIGTAKRKHRKQQRAQKAIRRRGFEFLKKFPPRSTSVPTIPSTSAHCEAVPSIRSIMKKSKFQNADPGRFARARG